MDNTQLQMQLIEGYNKRLETLLKDVELRKWCVEKSTGKLAPQEIYNFLTSSVTAELASSAIAPSPPQR